MKTKINYIAWRILSPAISLLGQLFIISYSKDISYQNSIFNLFIVQILSGAFEYIFFMSAQKENTVNINRKIYVVYVFIFSLSILIADYNLLIFLAVNLIIVRNLSILYLYEKQSSSYLVLFLGVSRSFLITFTYIIYALDLTYYYYAIIFVVIILINGFVKNKDIKKYSKSNPIYYFVIAIIVPLFFLWDRYEIKLLEPGNIYYINLATILINILLTISNILTVTASVNNFIVGFIKKNQFLILIFIFFLISILIEKTFFNVLLLGISPILFILLASLLFQYQKTNVVLTMNIYGVLLTTKIIIFYIFSITECGIIVSTTITLLSPLILININKFYEKYFI